MTAKKKSKDLKPIKSLSMVDQVELKLREYFREKSLQPGDSIPKETELAESLDVSRNVVREALSRLRMQGLVESKKKRGMVFSRPDLFNGLKRLMDPQILSKNTLQDLFELRMVIEMGLAELLFMRKTLEDIKALEKIVEKHANNSEKKEHLKHELEFHGKIYKITGNPTLEKFQEILWPIFGYIANDPEQLNRWEPYLGKVNHRDIIETIKTGDPRRYREVMFEHLKPHFERLKK